MNIKNFEFKAKVDNIDDYENKLLKLNPVDKRLIVEVKILITFSAKNFQKIQCEYLLQNWVK